MAALAVVLPAARERLTDDDWREIADTFGRNGDPRFDRIVGEDFRELFARIMNLALPPGEQTEIPTSLP